MNINWEAIFVPDITLIETVVRGSIMYLALFILLRVILKRQSGTLGITDLLLITLLADASQNGMAGDYKSISNGIVLVATIIFWDFALDWLSYKSPGFQRLIEAPPLLLVKNGQLLRRNMRKELITDEDLLMQLREQGISDISKVKEAYMESDGHISVVEKKEKHQQKQDKKP
jgi:uncharacterized membrane protein YcaP (DUF421 family)